MRKVVPQYLVAEFSHLVARFWNVNFTFSADCFKISVEQNTIILSSVDLTISWETCSWKGQLERTKSWKVRNEIGKIEVGKFGPKLERLKLFVLTF